MTRQPKFGRTTDSQAWALWEFRAKWRFSMRMLLWVLSLTRTPSNGKETWFSLFSTLLKQGKLLVFLYLSDSQKIHLYGMERKMESTQSGQLTTCWERKEGKNYQLHLILQMTNRGKEFGVSTSQIGSIIFFGERQKISYLQEETCVKKELKLTLCARFATLNRKHQNTSSCDVTLHRLYGSHLALGSMFH